MWSVQATQAFEDGRYAYGAGMSIDSNPHPVGHVEWYLYRDGWTEARDSDPDRNA